MTLSGGDAVLWKEVPVPAQVYSATVYAYQTTLRVNYILAPGSILVVTTENAEYWNFIAEGVKWDNCPCTEG